MKTRRGGVKLKPLLGMLALGAAGLAASRNSKGSSIAPLQSHNSSDYLHLAPHYNAPKQINYLHAILDAYAQLQFQLKNKTQFITLLEKLDHEQTKNTWTFFGNSKGKRTEYATIQFFGNKFNLFVSEPSATNAEQLLGLCFAAGLLLSLTADSKIIDNLERLIEAYLRTIEGENYRRPRAENQNELDAQFLADLEAAREEDAQAHAEAHAEAQAEAQASHLAENELAENGENTEFL